MIGVGIVGLSAARGWASVAHHPALRALGAYELRGVAGSTRESAQAAARRYSIPVAFSDAEALAADPAIDLVVIAVKAPLHGPLVRMALTTGKPVYCEWPLGVSLGEAADLLEHAQRSGSATVVGLQARLAPPLQYVRDLVRDGYCGAVLSTTVVGASSARNMIPQGNEYMLDESSGANLLTVAFGHTADAVAFVLDEFETLAAETTLRRPTMLREATGEPVQKTAPDHVGLVGTLRSGVPVVMHLREGLAGPTGLRWEINGTEGTLHISGSEAVPEIVPLAVQGQRGTDPMQELPVPATYRSNQPTVEALVGTPAYNVARTYEAFAAGRRGPADSKAPSFATGVARHRMIEAVAQAASTGCIERVGTVAGG